MDILDTAGACFMVDDDLLNFTLEAEVEEDEGPKNIFKGASASSSSSKSSTATAVLGHGSRTGAGSFPGFTSQEFVEEELEWLSNKDAFPAVETCFGILSENPELILNRQSPVSVLENSSSNSNSSNANSNSNSNGNGSAIASCCGSLKVPANFPVRSRSKRRRRKRRAGFGELLSQQCLWLNQVNVVNKRESSSSFLLPPLSSRMTSSGGSMGRRCLHCQADKTPQWRAGPMGPKTLCNACGVRYKSGRLLPEYRPANSPTFSSTLHSNSHRKVIEMRRQKQQGAGGGIMVDEACGYRVG